MFDELKKRAGKRGPAAMDGLRVLSEEEMFGSLLTRRRSLDLRFSTAMTR